MPTPFYHLSLAKELLIPGHLPENIRGWLIHQCPAFLLGNVAPDVQTLSSQTRQETHFFTLPLEYNTTLPWEALWKAYPTLSQCKQISKAQTAFLAGYICHLQADWLWVTKIFEPCFGKQAKWGDDQHRLYIHNVLRAHLEQQVLHLLDSKTGILLEQAIPRHWLPFVEDSFLCQWRDFLAQQLAPGCKPKTVEVFARRQGIPCELFHQILDSEQRMQQDVFVHLSTPKIHRFRKAVIDKNIKWLIQFLQPKNVSVRRADCQDYPGASFGDSL